MNTKFLILAAISVVTFSVSACTEESSVFNKAPGTYESSTSRTNSNGTNVSQDTTTKVSVDKYGNKSAVIETETTKDPEGLFNKTTTTEKKKIIENRY